MLTPPPSIRFLGAAFVASFSAIVPAVAHDQPHAGEDFTIPSLGIDMIWIEPGAFRMGSPETEPGHEPDERVVDVRFTEGFWIGRTEVTVAQWRQFVEETGFVGTDAAQGIHVRTPDGWELMPDKSWREPGIHQTDHHPVVGVSWEDAMSFADWVNKRERASGRLPTGWAYALPTEPQWEYACRAGTQTAFAWGDKIDTTQANYDARTSGGDSLDRTTPAAHFAPNAWELYDMHGNVWEWCADTYRDYPKGELVDPAPASGDGRKVKRGGSWQGAGENCRSANRNRDAPGYRSNNIGFRLSLRRSEQIAP